MVESNSKVTELASPICDTAGVPTSVTMEYTFSKLTWFHDHSECPPDNGRGFEIHDWKSYLSVLSDDLRLPFERVTDIDVQLQLRMNGESVFIKDWSVRVGHISNHMIRGTYKWCIDDRYINGQTSYLNLYVDGNSFERMNFIISTQVADNLRKVPIKRCYTIGNYELDESKEIMVDLADAKLIITFKTDGAQYLSNQDGKDGEEGEE